MLRIEGQKYLKALKDVSEEQAGSGKAQHRIGVFAPVHFLIRVHAGELVNEPLKGTENRIQPGAFAFQHASQINAHRTNGCEQDERVDGKCNQPLADISEFLREQQCEVR